MKLISKILITIVIIPNFLWGSECIVLLHGLGRTSNSMKPIQKFLTKENYTVVNLGYKSTKHPIEDLCSLYIQKQIDSLLPNYDKVHFVTHSMGGISIRYFLQGKIDSRIGCIIMLGPPNQGSHVANFMKKNFNTIFRFANGDAGQVLNTSSGFLMKRLQPINYPIGIIAGDKSFEFFSFIIPGKDDGKVAVENTKLKEMTDFTIVHHTHTFMMNSKDVHQLILNFLKNGKFR